MDILLGADIGTTNIKVLATTPAGAEICLVGRPTSWQQFPGGLAQQDGRALADAAIALMGEAAEAARQRLGPVRVLGIGLTGMAEVGQLIGRGARGDLPAIIWYDPRGAEQMAALPSEIAEAYAARTGMMFGPLPSCAKLLWAKASGLALAGRMWLGIVEYIAYRLGAQPASELSFRARTGLLDTETLQLWPPLADVLGIDESFLPLPVSAGTPLGRAGGDNIPALLRGAVITVAGHDHPVAAVGCGAFGPNDLFDSLGTAEALVRSVDTTLDQSARDLLARFDITYFPHVLPHRRVMLAGTKAGRVLKQVLGLLGAASGGRRTELDLAAVERDVAGLDQTVQVRGASMRDDNLEIRGIADDIAPEQVWLAAVEHIADSSLPVIAAMEQAAGRKADRMIAAGGWAHMASIRRAKAARCADITFARRQQAGAFGAALFAAHAVTVAAQRAQHGDHSAIAIDDPSGPTQELLETFVLTETR